MASLTRFERADVFGQRPVHQHGGLAFGLQAVEHLQRARDLAGEHRFAELEDVVAGDVEHRGLDLVEAQRAWRVQQRQLLQLLVRGEQVAFDAVGKERQRALAFLAVGDALALRGQALGDPRRQLAALDRLDPQHHAGASSALNQPLFCCWKSSLGSCTSVSTSSEPDRLAVALQRLRAFLAGLARRNAQLDQLPLGKQAHRLRRADQRAPVEVRRVADGEDLALAVAGGTRGGADRIAGLLRQQRLVAVHRVQRAQALGQVRGELVGLELHGQSGLIAARRRSTWATMSSSIARYSSASSCALASAAVSL